MLREVVTILVCRILTLYRSNTSKRIARVADRIFNLFTYFNDYTCSEFMYWLQSYLFNAENTDHCNSQVKFSKLNHFLRQSSVGDKTRSFESCYLVNYIVDFRHNLQKVTEQKRMITKAGGCVTRNQLWRGVAQINCRDRSNWLLYIFT